MSLLTSAATRSGRTVWAGFGLRWGRRIDQGLGDERGGNGEVGERLKAKIGKAGPKKRKKQGVLTTDDTDHTDFGLGQGRI